MVEPPELTSLNGDVTRRLCQAFVDSLNVSGASITVFGLDGQQSTVCTSDELAARGDLLQLELGEGPHWDVLSSGKAVLCPDLSAAIQQQWPAFSAAAVESGMVGVFSFPMTLGAITVGAVDLYTRTPRVLEPREVSLALTMASQVAAAAVRRAMLSANDHDSVEAAMAPALRLEVHQATGMIQAQLDTNATNAFSRLRAHAFVTGRDIEDIARDVVARRLDFSALAD